MSTLWLLVVLGHGTGKSLTTIVVDRCDLVEVNHVYDGQAKLIFEQVIWYDWVLHHDFGKKAEYRYQVMDWRILRSESQYPVKNYGTGLYVAEWHDAANRHVLRRVTATLFRETWTCYDPEVLERSKLLPENRRQLSRVPKAECHQLQP